MTSGPPKRLKQRCRVASQTVWLAEPGGIPGHSATFTEAATSTSLTSEVLFDLPLTQTTGLAARLSERAGPYLAGQDFISLSRRQTGVRVAVPYLPGTGALQPFDPLAGIAAQYPAGVQNGLAFRLNPDSLTLNYFN